MPRRVTGYLGRPEVEGTTCLTVAATNTCMRAEPQDSFPLPHPFIAVDTRGMLVTRPGWLNSRARAR